MSKYKDLQYKIERPEPSKLFLLARSMAGSQIQKQFNRFNTKVINSSNEGFKWIKAELTYPSFDHLTFAYKNAVFSVIIEIMDNNQTSLSNNQRERLIKVSEKNNLIPCVFRLKIKESKKEDDITESDLIPLSKDWNLVDIRNGKKILPENIGNSTKVEMSEWELQNFAIQIVRNDIEKEGDSILSFCDLIEVNPQIWFKDTKGRVCWVIVKHITKEKDFNHLEWVGLETKDSQLIPHDGFFAGVQFASNESQNLFRGDGMIVKYKGLKRIYVS